MGEIYIDCQPVNNEDEKIVIKKKKVSFEGDFGEAGEEVQIVATVIVTFGVLCTVLYFGRKYFFTKKN